MEKLREAQTALDNAIREFVECSSGEYCTGWTAFMSTSHEQAYVSAESDGLPIHTAIGLSQLQGLMYEGKIGVVAVFRTPERDELTDAALEEDDNDDEGLEDET